MKQKIFEALKTKFKDLGFSKEALEGVATQLTAFVTEEDKIETAVAGSETVLKALQSHIDSRVNTYKTENDKHKTEIEQLKSQLANKGKSQNENEDKTYFEELFAQKMNEVIKPFQDKIEALEAKEKADARKSFIGTKVKELGIPDWRVSEGFAIDDQMDETQIVAYLSNIKQNIQAAGLQSKSGLPVDFSDKPTAEEVSNIINNLM